MLIGAAALPIFAFVSLLFIYGVVPRFSAGAGQLVWYAVYFPVALATTIGGVRYAMLRAQRPTLWRVLHEHGFTVCPECGYDTRGIDPNGRCPECGGQLANQAAHERHLDD
jgi:hypothetical protein